MDNEPNIEEMQGKKEYRGVIITTIVVLLVILGIIHLSYSNHKQFQESLISQTQQQLQAIANATSGRMEEFIRKHSNALKVISMNPEVQKNIYQKVIFEGSEDTHCPFKTLYEIYRQDVGALTAIDLNGKLLHRYPSRCEPPLNLSTKPGITYVLKEHKPYISELFYNNLGQPAISISEPVYYQNAFVGAVRWMFQVDTISRRFIETIKVGKRGYAWVINDKEMILSFPQKEFIGMSLVDAVKKLHFQLGEIINEEQAMEDIQEDHPYLVRILAEDEGCGIFTGIITHEKGIVAFKKISMGKSNWHIVVTLPYSEISGLISKNEINTFGIAGLLILLLGILGVIFYKTQKRKAQLEIKTMYLKNIAKSAEALRESEEKLEGIIASVTDHMSIIDEYHTIIWANDVAKNYFKANLIGSKCYSAFFNREKECESCIVDKCFLDGKIYQDEFEFITEEGNHLLFWRTVSVSAWHKHGRPRLILEVRRNITERKKLEEELQKMEKLESLGVLAGGIAHDFNNLLTAIGGNISLAEVYEKSGQNVSHVLNEAEKASRQAKNLTQQLLTFSKGGAPIKNTTSLSELLNDMSIFALRGSNVKCKVFISEDLWPIEVDKGQISQVINNLIINANQAMADGGIIELAAENIIVKTNERLSLKKGEYIKISIKDQGIGIPKKYLQKIFDPFFTTKQQGSGLGLATSYAIIKKHDGNIFVESELGVGTTFSIYLPAAEKKIFEVKSIKEEKLCFGGGNILFMDDQKDIRLMAGEMLQHLGYQAKFAKDGAEAIELYKKAKNSQSPFEVVILDLTVPGGVGGKETIRKLKEINPEVKAIVSSGYCNDPIFSQYKEYGFIDVVTKPYEIRELSEVLYRIVKEA